jgi:hypothetical protein
MQPNAHKLKGLSSCLRVLTILLYQAEVPGCQRYSNGFVRMHTASFCREFGSQPAFVVLYLQLLSSSGFITHLKLTRGYSRFYLRRPDIFKYSDSQEIPEGEEQMSDACLVNHAQRAVEYKASQEITNSELMEQLKRIESQLNTTCKESSK